MAKMIAPGAIKATAQDHDDRLGAVSSAGQPRLAGHGLRIHVVLVGKALRTAGDLFGLHSSPLYCAAFLFLEYPLFEPFQNPVDPVWESHGFLKAFHSLGRHFRIRIAIIVLRRLGILQKFDACLERGTSLARRKRPAGMQNSALLELFRASCLTSLRFATNRRTLGRKKEICQ